MEHAVDPLEDLAAAILERTDRLAVCVLHPVGRPACLRLTVKGSGQVDEYVDLTPHGLRWSWGGELPNSGPAAQAEQIERFFFPLIAA